MGGVKIPLAAVVLAVLSVVLALVLLVIDLAGVPHDDVLVDAFRLVIAATLSACATAVVQTSRNGT